jgi:hypothetical protein
MGIDNAAAGGAVSVWPIVVRLGLGVAAGYVLGKLLFRPVHRNPLPWHFRRASNDENAFFVDVGAEHIGYVILGRSGWSAHGPRGALLDGPFPSHPIAGAVVYARWIESSPTMPLERQQAAADTLAGFMEVNPEWVMRQLDPTMVSYFVGDTEIAMAHCPWPDKDPTWEILEMPGMKTIAKGIKTPEEGGEVAFRHWSGEPETTWADIFTASAALPELPPEAIEEAPELFKVFARAEQEAEQRAEKAEKTIARRPEKRELPPEVIEGSILDMLAASVKRGKKGRGRWYAPMSDAEIASRLGITIKEARDTGIQLANEGLIYAHTAMRMVPEATELRDPKGRRIMTSQKRRRKRTMFSYHGPRGERGHIQRKGRR